VAERRIFSAAIIQVEPSGQMKLIESPIGEAELRKLNERVQRYGYEPIGSLEDSEHIRLKDPEGSGFHQDYAVRRGLIAYGSSIGGPPPRG
jgi:hypothetical protein